MNITPDSIVFVQIGPFAINATLVFTWVVMALLGLGSWLVTRRLSVGPPIPKWQNLLEIVVKGISDQIEEISRQDARPYLPFIGTLFLFIAVSNLLSIVPGYHAPTGSLSTTSALAICVFVAVPLYSIAQQGLAEYLRHYIRPTPFMLPFHIIGDLSRTLALAVRLFGNVMSGAKVVAILLAIVPFFFPIVMQALELLIGLIQSYIFAVLAMVYIASASRTLQTRQERSATEEEIHG